VLPGDPGRDPERRNETARRLRKVPVAARGAGFTGGYEADDPDCRIRASRVRPFRLGRLGEGFGRRRAHRARGFRRAICASVSPPRSRLGWIRMIQLQNSHFTRPSTWISVEFERPQFRQCQFRTDSFMKCPLSRRSPATGASRKAGAEPSEGSEETRVSRRRTASGRPNAAPRPRNALRVRGISGGGQRRQEGSGVVRGAGGGVPAGVGETGAGVPSTPRTSPAGVRSAATGVVSGVGGAGSAAERSVRCSAVRRREHPGASRQRTATTARI
jgi:hypothetical protein